MQDEHRRTHSWGIKRRVAAWVLGAVLVVSTLAPAQAMEAPRPAGNAVLAPGGITSTVVPSAKIQSAKAKSVKTTANLNLRSKPSTVGKKLVVIPKGTTLAVRSSKSGWSQLRYAGKNGWASNTYLRAVTAAPKSLKRGDLGKTTAALRLRTKPNTTSKSLATVPKHGIYTVKGISRGYAQITRRGKTGWVQSKYLKIVAKKPGREIYSDKKYTTNRAGLTDRYWTKVSGGDLYESVKGKIRVGDIPRNSVVYRDKKSEKTAGSVKGWVFVRTQGMTGWMKTSQLARKSKASTNPGKHRAKTLKAQPNGKVQEKMLVAIGWDKEKTLIAAPALKDLTRLNTAFKKKFGRNMDIDLAYRTRATQDYYWGELGPYIAARPGTSNHGWGTAIDTPETFNYSFRGKYYKWLKTHSKKFNWVHRKNLEEGSPYAEAWHFEYVGK